MVRSTATMVSENLGAQLQALYQPPRRVRRTAANANTINAAANAVFTAPPAPGIFNAATSTATPTTAAAAAALSGPRMNAMTATTAVPAAADYTPSTSDPRITAASFPAPAGLAPRPILLSLPSIEVVAPRFVVPVLPWARSPSPSPAAPPRQPTSPLFRAAQQVPACYGPYVYAEDLEREVREEEEREAWRRHVAARSAVVAVAVAGSASQQNVRRFRAVDQVPREYGGYAYAEDVQREEREEAEMKGEGHLFW